MAELSFAEKSLLEKLLDMSGGYVLKFTNRTMAEFFADCVGIDILGDQYAASGDSKARRMREFWKLEGNLVVGKVLSELIAQAEENKFDPPSDDLVRKCTAIADRLLDGVAVEDIKALDVPSEERSFQLLAASVRDSIDAGNPDAALDRLHTYVVKYMRQVCDGRQIDTAEEKPLHSLMGEYTKALRAAKIIESEISERILKNTISVFESFNHVRNRHSLAHDNDLLGQAESLLIVSHVVSTIRFIRTVEG